MGQDYHEINMDQNILGKYDDVEKELHKKRQLLVVNEGGNITERAQNDEVQRQMLLKGYQRVDLDERKSKALKQQDAYEFERFDPVFSKTTQKDFKPDKTNKHFKKRLLEKRKMAEAKTPQDDGTGNQEPAIFDQVRNEEETYQTT